MSSHIACLDGNAATGELGKVFAMDVTAAQGQCKHCGATRRFVHGRFCHLCPVPCLRAPTPWSCKRSPGCVSGCLWAGLLAIRHDWMSVEHYGRSAD